MKRATILVLLAAILTSASPALAQSEASVCSVDYKPYTKSELGDGIWAEIVSAAFKSAKIAVKWEVLPSVRCNEMARGGSILAAFNSVKTFEGDKDRIVFESPVMFNIDMVAFYDSRKFPKGLEFETPKELGKYRLGLLQGTGSVGVFKEAGVEFQTILTVESMVKMLDAGRVDAIVLGDLVGLFNLKKYLPESADAFKYKSVYSSPVDLGFSTKFPNYESYFARYQEGMKAIKKDGTYLAIFAKHYGGAAKINAKSLASDMRDAK